MDNEEKMEMAKQSVNRCIERNKQRISGMRRSILSGRRTRSHCLHNDYVCIYVYKYMYIYVYV